jgi:hypothetical protein
MSFGLRVGECLEDDLDDIVAVDDKPEVNGSV